METHARTHARNDCSWNWVSILVGVEILWEEEGFQFGFKRCSRLLSFVFSSYILSSILHVFLFVRLFVGARARVYVCVCVRACACVCVFCRSWWSRSFRRLADSPRWSTISRTVWVLYIRVVCDPMIRGEVKGTRSRVARTIGNLR